MIKWHVFHVCLQFTRRLIVFWRFAPEKIQTSLRIKFGERKSDRCYLCVSGRAFSWRCCIASWMARWGPRYREHFAASSGRAYAESDGARGRRRIRSARVAATTSRNPVVGTREGPNGGSRAGRRPPVFSRIAPFVGPLTRWRVHKVSLNPTKRRVPSCVVSFLLRLLWCFEGTSTELWLTSSAIN